MLVKDLIEILKTVDGDLPIATCANNHEYFSDKKEICVSLAHHYTGNHIIIGNQWQKDLNSPNWFILKDIYGKTSDNVPERYLK